MNKKKTIEYFSKEDIIFFCLKEGLEYESVEVAPNFTVELGKNNEIIGIEILQASKYFRKDTIANLGSGNLIHSSIIGRRTPA